MKPDLPPSPPLTRSERVALAVALGAIVGLHVVNLRSAGPLWRDEIGDVVYASMRSWGDIWANLKYDNFPPGLLAALRAWQGMGFAGAGAAAGYRAGGLLVGLALAGAFWVNARLLGARAPFASLGLFAASGLVIRVGDSVRPYGLGWMSMLLTVGLLWRVARAERPAWRTAAPAAVGAVLAVQFLYQNAFLLLAVGAAGMIVAARARRWRAVAAVAGIGALAAGSLLPYALGPVREAGAWSTVSRTGLTWPRLETMGWAALGASGEWRAWLWVAAGAALAGAVWTRARREALLYAGLAAGVALPLFVGFLKGLGMATSTWYYLPPLAIVAGALDAAADTLRAAPGRARLLPAAFLALVVGCTLPGAWREVRERVTNADLVAREIGQLAAPDDLVVVQPWPCGVSFQYYYRGAATWTTLPPLEDNSIHRFDLMKRRMESPEGDAPLLARMEQTLRGGHRVWVAGWINNAPPPGSRVRALRPAPDPISGWNEVAYLTIWAAQAREFLLAHKVNGGAVTVVVPDGQAVNETERMQLIVVDGWRP